MIHCFLILIHHNIPWYMIYWGSDSCWFSLKVCRHLHLHMLSNTIAFKSGGFFSLCTAPNFIVLKIYLFKCNFANFCLLLWSFSSFLLMNFYLSPSETCRVWGLPFVFLCNLCKHNTVWTGGEPLDGLCGNNWKLCWMFSAHEWWWAPLFGNDGLYLSDKMCRK